MKFMDREINELQHRVEEIVDFVYPLRTDLPEGNPIVYGYACPVNEEHDLDWHERNGLLQCNHCKKKYHQAQCVVPEKAFSVFTLATHDVMYKYLHDIKKIIEEKEQKYRDQAVKAENTGQNGEVVFTIKGRRQAIKALKDELF